MKLLKRCAIITTLLYADDDDWNNKNNNSSKGTYNKPSQIARASKEDALLAVGS